MFGSKKGNKTSFIETASKQQAILSISDDVQGLDFLVSLMGEIRTGSSKKTPEAAMNSVIAAMHQSPVLLKNCRQAILSQLIKTDFSTALIQSGIPLARGFWQEFFGRLRHKLLPPLQSEDDFLYVLNRVFFRSDDYKWVEAISREKWIEFFESIGLSLHFKDGRILQQLLRSLKTLTFQVAQLGFEKEILQYIPDEFREDNPFVEQNVYLTELEKRVQEQVNRHAGIQRADVAAMNADLGTANGGDGSETPDNDPDNPGIDPELTRKIEAVLEKAYQCLDHIGENQSGRGASLHQTYLLILLNNRLDRISILVDLLNQDNHYDTGKFVDFFRVLVRNENRKNSIIEFMSQTMGYLAYQIAEHKGVKGDKYITSTWAEYRRMLLSAMGGGGWVCLIVLIKNLLIKTPMAIFWHGFAYSMNYSLGFILIEETHTTLATKQPAFTASALASSLDTKKNSHQPNLYNLAVTVAKVSRSQIASFAGNLIIVFPGVWVLAWLYEKIMGSKLIEGKAAAQMLRDQHPWQSLSLLYACNTGVFLFLSGIIAGYVQNKIQYSRVSKRMQIHPLLRLSFSPGRLRRMADYTEKHAGAIAGSIALGFFLGMSSIVVHVFGIPFDIRHITISAGNTSLAVYGLGFSHVRFSYIFTVVMGVLGIGLLNFLVSFSLAFFVAVKSRGVHLRDYPEFLGILYRYFSKNPLDFIRPRKRLPEA